MTQSDTTMRERVEISEEAASRFWSKVDKRGDNDCWLWTGSRSRSGYGSLTMSGKPMKAHRVSFMMANDGIPKGLFVCHTCDNPPCVNPRHLFSGTARDNVEDMVRKGRNVRPVRDESKVAYVRGMTSPAAKLTDQDVLDIRRRRATGELRKFIAADYGVDVTLVSQIAYKKIWKHI